MILPPGFNSYYYGVINKIKKLISYGFWYGISDIRLSKWLTNFENDKEKYFAARILDNLIFRSSAHFKTLLREMIITSIPSYINYRIKVKENGFDLLSKLYADENEYNIRFVLSKGPNDHYAKSCFNVARLLDKDFRVSRSIIIGPNDLINDFNEKNLYFICDDFSGTGDQFISNISSYGLEYEKIIKNKNNIVFHPMIIHEDSIKNLKKYSPMLNICFLEMLSKNHSVFSENSTILYDGINSLENFRSFYIEMCNKFNFIGTNNFGFKDQSLLLAFEDSSPDNSLPILYYSGNKFQPLFNRT